MKFLSIHSMGTFQTQSVNVFRTAVWVRNSARGAQFSIVCGEKKLIMEVEDRVGIASISSIHYKD